MDDPKAGYNIYWLYGALITAATTAIGWVVQALSGRRKSEFHELLHGQRLMLTHFLTVVDFMSQHVRECENVEDRALWQARITTMRQDISTHLMGPVAP